MKSDMNQKVIASAVNVLIVMTLSLPIYLLQGWEAGRISSVTLFFLYNVIFRKRCLGMMVAGTTLERPANLRFVTLYTLSFSTMFWSWQVPLDLALLNLLGLQIPCVIFTGNTFHGLIAGQWTRRINDPRGNHAHSPRWPFYMGGE